MANHNPQGINEFPLTEETARKIMNDLAENYTHRIRWTKHVKQRMHERGITTGQVITLLKVSTQYLERGHILIFLETGNLV